MGGHLKEPCSRSEGEAAARGGQSVSESLPLGHASSALVQTGLVTLAAHTCFHPCLFVSCSRTHSLGRVTGAAAGAAAPLTPVPSSPCGDRGCCQVHALQLPCAAVMFSPLCAHCGDGVGSRPWAGRVRARSGDTPVSHHRPPR